MRSLAVPLATLALAPLLSAAVIDFNGLTAGTYQGSTTDLNVDDITVLGSDSVGWGIRSLDSGNRNDSTVVETGVIRPNNWQGKTFFRPTLNNDGNSDNDVIFSLTSFLTSRKWATNTDFDVIGIKVDNSTVTQHVVLNSDNFTVTLGAAFTGLKEVKIDFNEAGGTGSSYATFDNWGYSVPEPTAISLLGIGAVLGLRRRHQQSAP